MAQAFARIDAEHGRLDILVNNVGARNRKTLADTTPAEIRELIDTDLVAGLLLSKLAAERMVRQGGGRLIAITSVVGEFARAGDAVYPAAKQGLTGMMRALAAEFGGRGITSNAIAPGTFATETNAAMIADPSVGRASRHAIRRAAGASRRKSPAPPCSWPRAPRPMSTDTCWWWTADCRSSSKETRRHTARACCPEGLGRPSEGNAPRRALRPRGAVLPGAAQRGKAPRARYALATASSGGPAALPSRSRLSSSRPGTRRLRPASCAGAWPAGIMGKQFSCAATTTSRK